MLEIAKSNGKTSNNGIRLVVATLAIDIAKLAAAALAIPIAATPPRFATPIIPIITTPPKSVAPTVPIVAAPLKRGAYKATG